MAGRMRVRRRRELGVLVVAACVGAVVLVLHTGSPAAADSGPTGTTGATGATSCPSPNPPNELALVSGTPQTAQLGAAFGGGLAVALANTNGCAVTTPLAGIAVTFTAPARGAGAIFQASGSATVTVGTDAQGSATASMLTADQTAGSYTVTATCAYGSVSFTLTNTAAGIAARVTALGPARRSAIAGSRYREPLAVRVLDADGVPVAGVTVTFDLGSGAGSGAASAAASFDAGSAEATAQTDVDGVATSPRFTADATAGRFTATATVAHVVVPAKFVLDNRLAKPATVTDLGGARRSAVVVGRYRRLRVRVAGASGTPVAGATVTFTLGPGPGASAGGGSGAAPGASFGDGTNAATATTGPKGVATSPPMRANATAGTFTATITVAGTTRTGHFTLTNRPGSPATLTAGVAASEQAAVGTAFAVPLAVTVSDAHGNRVAGVLVTFSAPRAGAAGSFTGRSTATVRTDGSGIAVAPAFTANGLAGGYIVTATARGARPVAFALVNRQP